jgi:hypothetical protein
LIAAADFLSRSVCRLKPFSFFFASAFSRASRSALRCSFSALRSSLTGLLVRTAAAGGGGCGGEAQLLNSTLCS